MSPMSPYGGLSPWSVLLAIAVDREHIDPLDVAQWTFYVLSTSELDRQIPTQKTIRLGRLKALGARECKYDELKAAVQQAQRSIAAAD